MRLLVLGGTRVIGRHVVEAALAAGRRVTRARQRIASSSKHSP